ncbi:DUF7553 family protein [Halegenticoccus soli]|uniref:DUF7553 family protein n=1 Tax=Halegenticoccus soli TaxID=1985678 RepID=UPI000C6EBD62|nr:hypothetical protein [Halegenticoccus soli]
MARDLLHQAADNVEAVETERPAKDTSNRLASLADQLRSQAQRDATPALGVLDRIQHALHDIAEETDDDTVSNRLEDAREQIFTFLETLEDRGMKQHGWSENKEPNASANHE